MYKRQELGTFDDAVSRTKQIAGLDDANLVEYRERYDFSDFLSMFGQGSHCLLYTSFDECHSFTAVDGW